jgi:hypothetical protein
MTAAHSAQKVLLLLLGNNPAKAKTVLDSLRGCEGIDDYLLLVCINDDESESLDLAKKIDFAQVRIVPLQEPDPQRRASLAWRQGFRQADFVICLTGETVLAPDALLYFEHCRRAYQNDSDIFSVSARGEGLAEGSIQEIARRPASTAQVMGLWKDRWQWAEQRLNPGRCLDNLEQQLREGVFQEIYPLVSRCFPNDGQKRLPKEEVNQFEERQFFHEKPLVTAIMVTGLHPVRYALARVAVECFRRQTYPRKELLIINHGRESLHDGDDRITELRTTRRGMETVGDLRNLGLQHARGEFIACWDDDDWYHPERIARQMEARQGDRPVLLKNRICCSLENGCARYQAVSRGGLSTMLHPRKVPFRYKSLVRGSDAVFMRNFVDRIVLDNDPGLYIRFSHGFNLWDARSIMKDMAGEGKKDEIRLNEGHRRHLQEVLSLYKGWNSSVSVQD